jgi:DNA-binding NtrC family response regulator
MNIGPFQESTYSPGFNHILLVEDEPNVAKGLEFVLEDEGYRVETALSGRSALDKLLGNGFDLVVSDLRLPDIDGIDMIKEVQKHRPETKVIIITGYPSVSSAVDAVRMGVMDYLRKPFTDEELVGSVRKALAQARHPSISEILSESEQKIVIQRQEVIRAIETASRDAEFEKRLDTGGALDGFQLSDDAKAAVISGDLSWIRRHVGELSKEQLSWIYRRLEREIW